MLKLPANASPALRLLALVWEEGDHSSWRTINRNMADALEVALRALRFGRDDFIFVAEHMRPGYWMGTDRHMLGECFYAVAVEYGNTSAAVAFERWKGRRPLRDQYKKRVFVGATVDYNGRNLTCTSISEDGDSVVLTRSEAGVGGPAKVIQRVKLDRKELAGLRWRPPR